MKNTFTIIYSLYLMIPAVLLFGWFAARDSSHEFIRQDSIEMAFALGTSAIILTIGHLTNRLIESAIFLRSIAVIYVVYLLARVIYSSLSVDFSWWSIPLSFLALLLMSIPAVLTYLLASDIIKTKLKENKSE